MVKVKHYRCSGYHKISGQNCPYNCKLMFTKVYAQPPKFCPMFSVKSNVIPVWHED